MKNRPTFTTAIMLTLVALVVLSVCPSAARAGEMTRWSVKTSAVVLDSDSPFSIEKPSGGRVHAGGDVELGAAIAIQYRLSDLIGVELAAAYSKTPEVEDTSGGDGYEMGEGPSFRPIVAGANFHLLSSDKFEVYLGPRAAFASFGDFDLDVDGEQRSFDVASEFGWGAAAGIGYRLGHSRWSFVAEATFLDMDLETSEHATGETTVGGFDPLIANLGVEYSF